MYNMRAIRAKETRKLKAYVHSQYVSGNTPDAIVFRQLTPLWSEGYEKRAAIKIEFKNGIYIRMTGSYRRIYRIWCDLHAQYDRCL